MRRLSDVTLLDILPPTMRHDPDAIAASRAIAPDYWRLRKISLCTLAFSGIGDVAESWLDELAEDLHVDFYDRLLPIEKKRELVKQSISMHRRKGTPWAVEELIRIVFGGGYVAEWFDYGGKPYHFKACITEPLETPEDTRRFLSALDTVKNLRSYLDGIEYIAEPEGYCTSYGAVAAVGMAMEITAEVSVYGVG